MEGPDHAASLEYNEFKELVRAIRIRISSRHKRKRQKIGQGEMINRENLGKVL